MSSEIDGQTGAVAAPRAELSAGSIDAFEAELRAVARALPDRIEADPDHPENGLARLVLTVVELLRNVLEHQAIRRMDGGSLTEEQVERLGVSLMRLNDRMTELKAAFHVTDDELNIDLGPLGRLR
ncbi:MAG: gas vesicle protein K [Gemmatimonadaceae bacterium]